MSMGYDFSQNHFHDLRMVSLTFLSNFLSELAKTWTSIFWLLVVFHYSGSQWEQILILPVGTLSKNRNVQGFYLNYIQEKKAVLKETFGNPQDRPVQFKVNDLHQKSIKMRKTMTSNHINISPDEFFLSPYLFSLLCPFISCTHPALTEAETNEIVATGLRSVFTNCSEKGKFVFY